MKRLIDKLRKMLTIRSITRFLFVSTHLSALWWVNWSFVLATYATVKLGQPFPLDTVSETAINVIIGALLCKVLENALEHNDGSIWGVSKGGSKTGASTDAPEQGAERRDL